MRKPTAVADGEATGKATLGRRASARVRKMRELIAWASEADIAPATDAEPGSISSLRQSQVIDFKGH
jgi:hypothetical protein